MKLVLVRHAQTPANIARAWHGHTDTPLTDLGYEQIEALGKSFHKVMTPDVIYSSPLQRARLTAEAIAKPFGRQVVIDERLIEFGIGDWEGISFDRLLGELNYFPRMRKDEHFRAPNGESRYEVTDRMTTAIEEIRARHQTESVAIVSHGMAMSLVLNSWFGEEDTKLINFSFDNTAITEIALNPHSLISHNNVDHLDADLRQRSNLISDRLKQEKFG